MDDESPFASGSNSRFQGSSNSPPSGSPFPQGISDTPPRHFPFTPSLIDTIRRRRAVLQNALFIDLLFSLAGIFAPNELSSYPPPTIDAYDDLVRRIEDSSWTALKKQCLVYYLLKFWSDDQAVQFASNKLLPSQFVMLADAYWLLDQGTEHVPHAVALLCDPRVKPDFISKLLYAISVSTSQTHTNILRFVRTAKPILTDPGDHDLYLRAICNVDGVVEAWHYQRTFPEGSPLRRRFIGVIFDFSLSPNPRAAAMNNLLTLPLTAYEESILHAYALHPPRSLSESSLAALQDLITLRLTSVGKYAEAIRLDRQFSSEAAKVGRMGSSPVIRASEKRKEMFEEIKSSLPGAQRKLLELLNEDTSGGYSISGSSSFGTFTAMSSSGELVNGDVEMSWEGIESSVPVSESSSFFVSTKPPSPTLSGFVNVQQSQQPLSASSALRQSNPQSAVFKAFASARPTTSPSSTPVPPNNIPESRVSKLLGLTGPSPSPRRNQNPFEASTRPEHIARKPSTSNIAPSTLFVSPSNDPPPEQSQNASSSTSGRPSLFSRSVSGATPWQQTSTTTTPVGTPLGKKGIQFPPAEPSRDDNSAPWASKSLFGNTNGTKRRRQSDVQPEVVEEIAPAEETNMEVDEDMHGGEGETHEEDDIMLEPPNVLSHARTLASSKRLNGISHPPPESHETDEVHSSLPQSPSRSLLNLETESHAVFPGAFPTSPKNSSQNLRKSAPPSMTTRAKKSNKKDEDASHAPLSPRKSTRRLTRASSANTEDEDAQNQDSVPLRRSARLSSLPPDSSPDRKKSRVSVEPESPTKSSKGVGSSRRSRGRGRTAVTSRGRPQTVVEE